MSELEDKLNAILGNPEAMSQIMTLAQSIGGHSTDPAGQSAPVQKQATPPAPTPAPDLSALLGSLSGGSSSGGGGLDPRLFQMATKIMSEYQARDGGRAELLQALRPFVKEQRYAKLDKAIQIAKLSRMIRVALDVFKGGGSEHV